MQDISGFGLKIRVVASVTFPMGFDLTQFADDADPLDIPSIQVRDKAMGVNGDLIVWSKGTPIPVSISLIPGSDDDRNMQVLLAANRTGKGKRGARDVISLVGIYPEGNGLQFQEGAITDGPVAPSVASSGRMKSSTYQFVFENVA